MKIFMQEIVRQPRSLAACKRHSRAPAFVAGLLYAGMPRGRSGSKRLYDAMRSATRPSIKLHRAPRRATASNRRRWIATTLALAGTIAAGRTLAGSPGPARMTKLFTFGDSVLDCGRYNEFGATPGQLLVRNDDALFPEFRGRDLKARGGDPRLEHRAVDGSTVADLERQAQDLEPGDDAVALLTIGGNDLLRGLAVDRGTGLRSFAETLERFLGKLPMPVVLGTVYDPTFGDDRLNFLGVEAQVARANHTRVNDVIKTLALRYGTLADLHAHFLHGDSSWFTRTIEPSLTGASEIRRVFLQRL
jgi:acyl-CoA thioesterase-1